MSNNMNIDYINQHHAPPFSKNQKDKWFRQGCLISKIDDATLKGEYVIKVLMHTGGGAFDCVYVKRM